MGNPEKESFRDELKAKADRALEDYQKYDNQYTPIIVKIIMKLKN
ncbi:MAG: hypothetical protein R2836_03545 [Chitinophagales bacterium]